MLLETEVDDNFSDRRRQAPQASPQTTRLVDPLGRRITYVRVSVTDRCDLRCHYCMTPRPTFMPKRDLLALEELDRICAIFVRLSIRKLRITGGEPLLRRDVMTLFAALHRHLASGSVDELTLTTNGGRLAEHASKLADCGVRRVNVSVDTRNPEKFRRITGGGDLGRVLAGVTAAKAAGLRVKINAVALRGVNDDELSDMVAWCGREGFDLTLIETGEMPRTLGLPAFDPANDRFMICGSPQMLADLRVVLDARGFEVSPRIGSPGHYVFERAFVEK